MYEHIVAEINLVKTPKFHVLTKLDADEEWLKEGRDVLHLPSSYLAFLAEVGAAKLFRELDYYLLGVYPVYKEVYLPDGDTALNFGYYDCNYAWFKKSQLGMPEPEVFYNYGDAYKKKFPDFNSWLNSCLKKARSRYTAKEWTYILIGPRPFSDREKAIVEARRMYSWKVTGVANDKKVIFTITNNSSLVMPYLSIGVRHKQDKFEGAVWLDVSSIMPGTSGIVKQDCYGELASLEELVFFLRPDPARVGRNSVLAYCAV